MLHRVSWNEVVALCALACILALGSGCELIVKFDRSRIPDAGEGIDSGPPMDAGVGCGNGALDGVEGCDDGNVSANDGCSATCTVETGWNCGLTVPSVCNEICGDGTIVGAEACDDGFTTACGACNDTCSAGGTPASCGDQMICTDSEQCDQGGGNLATGDGCNATCQEEAGWVCTNEPSTCAETCSNGVIDVGEDCDDGNTDDLDGCTGSCAIELGWECPSEGDPCNAICGDGTVITGQEACDDNNTTPNDGCAANCSAIDIGWECPIDGDPCNAICGDRMVIAGQETCDDGNVLACGSCAANCGAVGTGTCDNATGCAADSDCTSGFCNGSNVCAPCGGDGECTGSPSGEQCVNEVCRACDPTGDAGCGPGTPRCSPTTFTCVECVDVTDCDDSNGCTFDVCAPDTTCRNVALTDVITAVGFDLDTAAGSPSHDAVRIHNPMGGRTLPLTGYFLCTAQSTCVDLSAVTIAAGGNAIVGDHGTVSLMTTLGLSRTMGELAFSTTSDGQAVCDYLQWGVGNQSLATEAVNLAAWSTQSAFIDSTMLDVGEELHYDGAGSAPTDWMIQASSF